MGKTAKFHGIYKKRIETRHTFTLYFSVLKTHFLELDNFRKTSPTKTVIYLYFLEQYFWYKILYCKNTKYFQIVQHKSNNAYFSVLARLHLNDLTFSK